MPRAVLFGRRLGCKPPCVAREAHEIAERVRAARCELEQALDIRCEVVVHRDRRAVSAQPDVLVPERREEAPLAPAQLRVDAASDVLRQVLRILRAHPELKREHEQRIRIGRVWAIARDDLAELLRFDEPQHRPAIARISAQPIRLPANNRINLPLLNERDHARKLRPAGDLRRLRFGEDERVAKAQLAAALHGPMEPFDGCDLAVVAFGGLPGVDGGARHGATGGRREARDAARSRSMMLPMNVASAHRICR